MAELRNLREFFDPSFHAPVGDAVYAIPAPDVQEGLRITRLVLDDTLTADAEHDEIMKILAPVTEQMIADGVSLAELIHIGRTALLHFGSSPQIAQAHWLHGERGRDVIAADEIEATAEVETAPQSPRASRSRPKKAPAKSSTPRSRKRT